MQNNLFSIYQSANKEKLLIASNDPQVVRDYINAQVETARTSIQNIVNSDEIKEMHITKANNLTKRIAIYQQWLRDVDYTTMHEKGKTLEFFIKK